MLERWLAVELALVDVLAERGRCRSRRRARSAPRARVNPARMQEIEAEIKHDVIAFVSSVAETVGDEGRWLHLGLTSSDVVDTAFAMQLRDAADVLLASLDGLRAAVRTQAVRHRETPMIGRTHGIHAEPITFGLKCAGWYAELGRDRRRLAAARDDDRLRQAVGSRRNLRQQRPGGRGRGAGAPRAQARADRDAGRAARPPRGVLRHAWRWWPAPASASRSEIRHLQRTEVGEALEPFGNGQKGSSAMPHKRNPILVENLCGLARLVRSYAGAASRTWRSGTSATSATRRSSASSGPTRRSTLDFMLARLAGVVEGLEVRPDAMARNLARLGGAIFSEQVLLALVRKGVARDEAYRWIQRHALAGDDLEARLAGDADVGRHLSRDELHALFDMTHHLRHIDALFTRALEDGDRAGSPEDGDGAG